MNTGAISFLTALDIPAKAALSADGSVEAASQSGASDGFADLLDQLVQIAPAGAELMPHGAKPVAEPAGERQEPGEGGKETGKILPVLPDALPGPGFVVGHDMSAPPIAAPIAAPIATEGVSIAPEPQPAEARIIDLPVGRLDTARIAANNGLEAAPTTIEGRSAIGSGPSTDTARTLAQPVSQPVSQPMPASILPFAKPTGVRVELPPSPPASSTGPIAVASAPAPGSIAKLGGASISSITLVAQAPVASPVMSAPAQISVNVQLAGGSATALPAVPVTNDAAARAAPLADMLPVPASDTTRRIFAAAVSSPPPTPMGIAPQATATSVKSAEAKSGPAIKSGPIALAATGKTETVAETARPVEAVQAPARIAAASETARPTEPGLAATASAPAAATQTTSDIVTRAADLARPDAFAAVDSIARMVDRLSAARDFGAMPAAAIAVMHKEFGELSIAIDRVSDALQVEVTAKDGEAQRALAAALANERAAALAGDRTGQRPDAQQTQSATTQASGQAATQGDRGQADRGASDTSGQNAANTAQSQREGNRDAQRQDRARPDGQPLHARSASAADRQPAGDDGRYA